MLRRLHLPKRFGLPLLAKELVEQAARRRTYVIRTVYAVLLFAGAGLLFHDLLRRYQGVNSFQVLGQGREMFDVLIGLQFAGIYLFMPALACGAITAEKERDSLALLFLTRLGPWTILFEKLLSRLVPMCTFLLLSLPLLVFPYSLGGVSTDRLWGGVWTLAVTALQIGCLALACSAFFRTTVGAFIATYLFGFVLMFGPALACTILSEPTHGYVFLPTIVDVLGGPGSKTGAGVQALFTYVGWWPYNGEFLLLAFCGPLTFFPFDGMWGIGPSRGEFFAYVLRSVPMLLSAAVCLVLARVFVVRRAFVPPRNLLLNVFRRLDRFFHWLNRNPLTRGIVLIREGDNLPETDPVAWRETSKRALGTKRYLFRLLVALELPVVLVCLWISVLGAGNSSDLWAAGAMTMWALWIISVLIVSVTSASLIAGERTHQTLNVLVTPPLSAREIVQQKFRGVQRLLWLLAIPFATLILFETSWRSAVSPTWFDVTHYLSDYSSYEAYRARLLPPGLYLICASLSVVVYLPTIAWLSFWIGLWTRSQTRAIIGALGAIVCWCVLPFLLIIIPLEILTVGIYYRSELTFAFLFSPATVVALSEINALREVAHSPWLAVILNFLFYIPCLVLFRWLCLRFADRYLGRKEGGTTSDSVTPTQAALRIARTTGRRA